MTFKSEQLVCCICHTKGLTPSNLRFRAAAWGNKTDSYGMESSNTNLAVIRAVDNENIARDKLNINQRTKHGGKEINPKELIK